ncbi:MAG TPA: hypothetical protein VMR23_15970 [Candidatus Limnocylindria bacterium]|nr:hypothetical protein [Candidatus Limnocylindria bacterium]
MTVSRDAGRIFITAMLLYAAFWNPWMQFSNTSNFLDAAVSFVDTGRWELAHAPLYEGKDTATARDGRVVPGVPIGTAVAAMPLYAVWRALAGPVHTMDDFHGFNGFVALVLCAPAAALAAVQVAWLAGWLGAGRRGQVLAALLFALGTQGFQFGTMVTKESLAVLAVTTAVRLAVSAGGGWHSAAAGALAGAAVWLTHPLALLAPLLAGLVVVRHGPRAGVAFVAGGLPFAVALGAYNTWLFGAPWSSSYSAITGLDTRWVLPKPAILADFLVGPRGGLLLYSPFLLLAGAGLAAGWRGARRAEAVVTVTLLAGFWLVGASWQSQFADRASWSHGLGTRYLFPVLPLLAAFAAPSLERLGPRALALAAVPSLAFGYLGAQAGFAPVSNALPYALKTWVSGTGMGVLFKEALPAWLGVDTLHTVVSRADVTAADVLGMLPTPAGLALAAHQALFLLLNVLVLVAIGCILRRVWRPPLALEAVACAS